MAIRTYKPTTPSMRGLVAVNYSKLHRGRPEPSLTKGLSGSGGRNNVGRITARRRGGGHKRLYRLIDFKRNKFDMEGQVERLEYDPNRSAFIALIKYTDDELAYIIAPHGLKIGDKVIAAEKCDVKPGYAMKLKNIPVGSIIHNIEMKPGAGGKLVRSAGSSAQLFGRDAGYAQLKLASGEYRMIWGECMATVGVVSNADNKNRKYGKAGRRRWLGKRPSVRGVAMNPVDHPHGGGEGKSSGGRHPVTPWGKSTKGFRTRNNVKSDKFIMRRRKK